MPEGLERAKRYRHHAVELRTMAKDWRDADTLQKVNELARDYDRMAADLEKSARADEGCSCGGGKPKAPSASPPITSVED